MHGLLRHLCLLGAALTIAAVSVAGAAASTGDDELWACIKDSGAARLVTDPADCKKDEHPDRKG